MSANTAGYSPEGPAMSTSTEVRGEVPENDENQRDAILKLLEDGIQEARRKIEAGRMYDAENEKVRIQ